MRLLVSFLILTVGLATTPLAASQEPRPTPPSTEVLRAYVAKLPIGSSVKVTPKQGKAVKGILMVVDDATIVVKPRTRIARPEQRLALAEIDFVELQARNGSSTAKAVGIGVASAVGAFLSLILVTFAVIDD